MTRDDKRFMALQGLLQWTQGVVMQSVRLSAARNREASDDLRFNHLARHQAVLAFHSECHFFVIAAFKLIEYREWISTLRICATIDISEIGGFLKRDIKDLRNMREHIVEYFQGDGHMSDRWDFERQEAATADASSVIGTMIGGRLDWIKFESAAERLHSQLLAEPIAYPSR